MFQKVPTQDSTIKIVLIRFFKVEKFHLYVPGADTV